MAPGGVKLRTPKTATKTSNSRAIVGYEREEEATAPRHAGIYGKLQVIAGHLFARLHSRPSFVLHFKSNSFSLLFPDAISSLSSSLLLFLFFFLLRTRSFLNFESSLKSSSYCHVILSRSSIGFEEIFCARTFDDLFAINPLDLYRRIFLLVSHLARDPRSPCNCFFLLANCRPINKHGGTKAVGVSLLQREKKFRVST